MTAHKAFAIGTGIFLISFIAGANAGMISKRLIILENLINLMIKISNYALDTYLYNVHL